MTVCRSNWWLKPINFPPTQFRFFFFFISFSYAFSLLSASYSLTVSIRFRFSIRFPTFFLRLISISLLRFEKATFLPPLSSAPSRHSQLHFSIFRTIHKLRAQQQRCTYGQKIKNNCIACQFTFLHDCTLSFLRILFHLIFSYYSLQYRV